MVVVCVPWVKAHKHFLPHFIEWYARNQALHDLNLHWEMWRPLHEVQGRAVERARKIGASHILFTEDDHWGFPIDGLEVLLEADKEVIGFPTTYRDFPFLPMCMRKKDPAKSLITAERNLSPVEPGGGPEVQTVDLLTWAFTLVRMEVFDRLPADPFAQWGRVPTDSYFNEYCEQAGIPRHVHFAFWIEHGDVPRACHLYHRRMHESMLHDRGIYGTDAFTADAHPDTFDLEARSGDRAWIERQALKREALCVS